MGNSKQKKAVTQGVSYVGAIQRVTNTPKRGEDDDLDELEVMNKIMKPLLPYKVYDCFRQQQITTYYLSKSIGEPDAYVDMIHRIRTAQPQDIIQIHLNTVGGRLDTGIQLINAMKQSEARIVTVLDGKAFSLGTLIFLAADEFVVHDDVQFMIHNFSSAMQGKGNEQESELIATLAWFRKLATKYYTPFLTKDELDSVLGGKDMWMGADEVRRRLQRMVDIQNGTIADPDKKTKVSRAKKAAAAASSEVEVKEEVVVAKTKRTPRAKTA